MLGCPLYKKERERAGIQRETALQGLLFSQKGTAPLINFIQEIGIATRKWLLQSTREEKEEDSWGWESLQDTQERDGEVILYTENFLFYFHLLLAIFSSISIVLCFPFNLTYDGVDCCVPEGNR